VNLPNLTTQVQNQGVARPSAKKPLSKVSLPLTIDTRYSGLIKQRLCTDDRVGDFKKVTASKPKPRRLLPLRSEETLPRPPITKAALYQDVETTDGEDTSTSSRSLESSSILIPLPPPENDPEKKLKMLVQVLSANI
tara:strand:- start:522 stop:932 length:411 start_codon:yes stop_codon:yes gene_type:complete